MVLEADVDARLRLAADVLARHRFAFWHYGDSIGFEGLLAAADLLGEPRYEGWVHGFLKGWAAEPRPFRELDNTAPGHAMCLCFERTGDDAVIESALRLADYLVSRRRVDGVFASFERAPLSAPFGGESLPPDEAALLADPGAGVFVDCLHFDPPFFVHLGVLTGESRLVDLGADQALGYCGQLQDERGLFWHFRLDKTGRRYGYGWGRGQGWALLGLLDVLTRLPKGHGARDNLARRFARLSEALAERQLSAGGWPAVVTDPESGTEASTAAFAAAGFAGGISAGLLGQTFREAALRAWRAALADVRPDGVLADVSAGMGASTAASHYPNAPKGFVVPWGQGPLLLAAHRIAGIGQDGSAADCG